MKTFKEALEEPSPIRKELFSFFEPLSPLTIFDIGCCDGIDSIRYSRMFANAMVHSFEPIPDNFEKIQENIKNSGTNQVVAYATALSNTTGKIQMFVSSGRPGGASDIYNKSSSLLAPDEHIKLYPECRFDKTIEVNVDTLDNFCNTHNIKEIDFIHLDVQGAELMVLEGATKILPNIKVIWLEVETVGLYKNQPLRKDVQSFMRKNNFAIARYDYRFISGDQLYVNKNFIRAQKGLLFYIYILLKDSFIANFFFAIYTHAVIKKILKRFIH